MFVQGSEEGLTIDQRDSQYGQCGGGWNEHTQVSDLSVEDDEVAVETRLST